MRTRLIALSLAAALSLTVSGCTGDDKEPKSDDKTLAPRLENAKSALDDAETIDVSLATKSLPTGVTGLLSAEGQGNHSPAFKGKVKIVLGGATISADVVAVDGEVYAKTGFTPFTTVDPASLKAPDPAALIATEGGISELLVKTSGLTDGGKTRDGSTVLSTIEGTLSGETVKTLVPSADNAKSFKVVYSLDDDDELRDAKITGPFYPDGGNITYTVKVETSDTAVTITKP